MTLAQKCFIIAAALLGPLSGLCLFGTVLVFLLDVFDLAWGSLGVWLVVGGLCGALSYLQGGERLNPQLKDNWQKHPSGARTGMVIVLVTAAVLTILSLLFHALLWDEFAGSIYVPFGAPATLICFAAVLVSMILIWTRRPHVEEQ